MPATYAKILVAKNGGATASGGITVAAGDSVQLTGENTSGWGSNPAPLWQIYDYPPTFTQPSGWSTDGTGVYFFAGVTPPAVVMPAIDKWGKFMLRLTVVAGAQVLVDEASALSMLSAGGLEDLGWNEDLQFGGRTSWVHGVKRNWRTLEAGGGAGTLAGDVTGAAGANSVVGLTHVTSNLTFDATNHTVGMATSSSDAGNLTITAGKTTDPTAQVGELILAGPDGTAGTGILSGCDGGPVILQGGGNGADGGAGAGASGAVSITGGDSSTAGVPGGAVQIEGGPNIVAVGLASDGAISIGTNRGSSVAIAQAGITTTVGGPLTVNGVVSLGSGTVTFAAAAGAVAFSQTQNTTGVGSAWTAYAQRGKAGSIGGTLTLGGGLGGTLGTNLPGNVQVDLRGAVANVGPKALFLTDAGNLSVNQTAAAVISITSPTDLTIAVTGTHSVNVTGDHVNLITGATRLQTNGTWDQQVYGATAGFTMTGDFYLSNASHVERLGVDVANNNIRLFTGAGVGSGVGVITIANATTAPTTNPTAGGILFAQGGALKWKGPSGAVTTMGAA